MKMLGFASAAALVTIAMAGPAAAVETFDNAITLSPTQQAGAWYTDRYAPAGFQSQVFFDGDNRLKQTISASDAQANNFLNTQGRKFDLGDGTLQMSIDLYVSGEWQGSGNRQAGFWGTGFDTNGDVSAYPIIEFTETDKNGRFRVWDDDNGWIDLGLPSGFVYDTWYTLNISLANDQFSYRVGDLYTTVSAHGTTEISNVILQGYNTAVGTNADIYWDNLDAAVPEPATWGLMILGFGLLGSEMRRRRALIAA